MCVCVFIIMDICICVPYIVNWVYVSNYGIETCKLPKLYLLGYISLLYQKKKDPLNKRIQFYFSNCTETTDNYTLRYSLHLGSSGIICGAIYSQNINKYKLL